MTRQNSSQPFALKESNLSGAVEEGFTNTAKASEIRSVNPLWHLMNYLTGKCYAFSDVERAADFNANVARSLVREFIR